jgi:hypothetical protein
VTTVAERTLAALQHLRIDETSDRLLDGLITGLCSGLETPGEIAFGNADTDDSWRALTDPAIANLTLLPYAAQWVGGQMPPRRTDESDEQYLERAREEAIRPRGMRRGTGVALEIVARPFLTGTQAVSVSDFLDGSPWRVLVRVKPSECSDPDALIQALNDPEVCPAGILIDLLLSESPAWDDDALDGYAWDDVATGWDATSTWPP